MKQEGRIPYKVADTLLQFSMQVLTRSFDLGLWATQFGGRCGCRAVYGKGGHRGLEMGSLNRPVMTSYRLP